MATTEVFLGGATALLTLPMLLPALLVALAGWGASGRRSRAEHLFTAGVMALLFAAALSQRGVSGLDEMSRWIVVGLLVFAADLGRRRQGNLHASTVVWALILGSVTVLMRGDVYGPVLSVLRGSWQASPSRGQLFLYHLGSGVALGIVYWIFSELGRRMEERWQTWPAAMGVLLMLALVATGWIHAVQRELLLHFPPLRLG